VSDILANLAPDEPLPLGRYGTADGVEVTLKTVYPALATLIAGRNAASLAAAFETGLGAPLPQGPQAVSVSGLTLVGTGPGRWIVAADDTTGDALLERLHALAGSFGSVTDQTDASVVYDVSGPKAHEMLMKMLLIDIDPAVFRPGTAATTQAALIGTTLWQTEAGTYRFLIARSYALAFVRAVAASATEFGFEFG
jgi:sarcosine oxidase subunit gamma